MFLLALKRGDLECLLTVSERHLCYHGNNAADVSFYVVALVVYKYILSNEIAVFIQVFQKFIFVKLALRRKKDHEHLSELSLFLTLTFEGGWWNVTF